MVRTVALDTLLELEKVHEGDRGRKTRIWGGEIGIPCENEMVPTPSLLSEAASLCSAGLEAMGWVTDSLRVS